MQSVRCDEQVPLFAVSTLRRYDTIQGYDLVVFAVSPAPAVTAFARASQRISKDRQREIKRVEFATVEVYIWRIYQNTWKILITKCTQTKQEAEKFRKLVAEECFSRPAGLFYAANQIFDPRFYRQCNLFAHEISAAANHALWKRDAQMLNAFGGRGPVVSVLSSF